MVRKTETAETPSGGDGAADFGSLVDANGETFRAIMKANEAMLEGMAAVGREIIEFRTERTRRDLATSESLLHCNDVEEAFRLQCDYAREASQQYFEEAGRLRDRITVPASIGDDDARERALESPRVQSHIDGKTVRNVVYVPGRLVNVVVG